MQVLASDIVRDRLSAKIYSRQGSRHALKTAAASTRPKPKCVACRLFSAWRMSPSAVKMIASKPSLTYGTCKEGAQCWQGSCLVKHMDGPKGLNQQLNLKGWLLNTCWLRAGI